MRKIKVQVTIVKEPKVPRTIGRETFGVHFEWVYPNYVRWDTKEVCCMHPKKSDGSVCTRAKGHKGLHRADDNTDIKPWKS